MGNETMVSFSLCYLKDLVWGEHYLGSGDLKAPTKINGKQQILIGSGEK